MSAGVTSNTAKKYVDFREFVEYYGGTFYTNGQAFKTAFNSTSVSTVTLVIVKL